MDTMQLLRLIETDPLISDQDLADALNVTAGEVAAAKKRLENDKVICGYRTIINWDRTGAEHCDAIIQVSAKPERDVGYDRIAGRIARYPEVTSLYLMSGTSEFFVFIEGTTMREVSDFVARKLAPIEGVTATVTCLQLKQYKIEGRLLEEEKRADERLLVEP